MTKLLAAAAAVCALAAAAPAFAESMTATLEQPVAKPVKFIAGGAQWLCEGSSCRAPMANERTTTVAACASLAKEVGRVTVYGDGVRPFETSRLDKCNSGLAATTTVASAH